MNTLTFNHVEVRYEFQPGLQKNANNLVLLHSLGLSMEEFNDFVPHFLPSFHVLRFDMVGHGQSGLPSEPITVDMLVDQLHMMTQHFFQGRYYLIAGPGMGYVASRFCRIYHPSILGMVMISPPPVFLTHEGKEQLGQQIELAASSGFHAYKQFLLSHFTSRREPEQLCRLEELLNQTTEQVHLGLIQSLLNNDFRNDFQELYFPLLVLAGTQDTLFPASSYGMSANYMKAEFKIISAASHLAAWDNPEATAAAALDFFAFMQSGEAASTGFTVRRDDIARALYRSFEQTEADRKLTSPVLRVQLMNTFHVQIGEIELLKGWNLRKIRSLFLYLLFHGTVAREELIEVFWSELPMRNARNQLRMNLHFLKSLLNQGSDQVLHIDRGNVFLQNVIECDAVEYIHRLKEAYSRMISGDLDLPGARSILEISPKKLVTHVYDEWYLQFRNEIEEQYISLCLWTSECLNNSQEAEKYIQMIEKLQN